MIHIRVQVLDTIGSLPILGFYFVIITKAIKNVSTLSWCIPAANMICPHFDWRFVLIQNQLFLAYHCRLLVNWLVLYPRMIYFCLNDFVCRCVFSFLLRCTLFVKLCVKCLWGQQNAQTKDNRYLYYSPGAWYQCYAYIWRHVKANSYTIWWSTDLMAVTHSSVWNIMCAA